MAFGVLCSLFVIACIFLKVKDVFYVNFEGVLHMNQQVVEYYENLFKNEIMQKQIDGATKTLKELVAEFVQRDEAHHKDIHEAYLNVKKEIVG